MLLLQLMGAMTIMMKLLLLLMMIIKPQAGVNDGGWQLTGSMRKSAETRRLKTEEADDQSL